MTEQEKQFLDEDKDAKKGFPKYRAYIETLPFKKKVIEFLNLDGIHTLEKSRIIYSTFNEGEQYKFDYYNDVDKVIRLTLDRIIEMERKLNSLREILDHDFREIFVHDRNTIWLNNLLEVARNLTNDGDRKTIIKQIQTYPSPYVGIQIVFKRKTGEFVTDYSEIQRKIDENLNAITSGVSGIKSYFLAIRYFLEYIKEPRLLPGFIKRAEKNFECYDTTRIQFSSRLYNLLKKTPTKKRTEKEESLLQFIQHFQELGFTFPDVNTIEPNKYTLTENTNPCIELWKKRRQEAK